MCFFDLDVDCNTVRPIPRSQWPDSNSLSTCGAVPIERFAQSFFKRHFGSVAQIPFGGGGVRLGMLHVTRARWTVACRQADPFDLLQTLPNLVQCIAVAVAGVVDL